MDRTDRVNRGRSLWHRPGRILLDTDHQESCGTWIKTTDNRLGWEYHQHLLVGFSTGAVHVCVRVYVCTIYVCMCVYVCVCVYANVCRYVCASIGVCIYRCLHRCLHITSTHEFHACMYDIMCVCVCVRLGMFGRMHLSCHSHSTYRTDVTRSKWHRFKGHRDRIFIGLLQNTTYS